MEQEREVLTWADFDRSIWDLAERVAADGVPDMILSIARGGLLIGGALGYALGVKNTYTMNVEFYTGVDERLEVPRILPPAPDFVDLHDALVLVADDVADTGLTLASVHDFCAGKVGAVRTATIYAKPRSVVRPDYVGATPSGGSLSRGATGRRSPARRARRLSPAGGRGWWPPLSTSPVAGVRHPQAGRPRGHVCGHLYD